MIDFFCLEQNDEKIYAHQDLLIDMIKEFRKQIIDDYVKKKSWQHFTIMLRKLVERVDKKKKFVMSTKFIESK